MNDVTRVAVLPDDLAEKDLEPTRFDSKPARSSSRIVEFYVSRSGSVEGPFPIEKVREMLQQGQLTASDFGAPAGADDWSPLSQLLGLPGVTSAPPPIPARPSPSPLDQPFRVDGRVIPGTAGKSARQIVNEVAAGGRFVVFQYAFSLIVITFRRSSPIIYLAPGQSGVGSAFAWSLIPLFFGWWGIPWGPIYSIGALWRNSAGGVDVTEPILASLMGPMEANLKVRTRPKHKTGALWALRALFLSPLILFPLFLMIGAAAGAKLERERARLPGYADYKRAEEYVGSWSGSDGKGNNAKATDAAETFTNVLKAYRTLAVSESKSKKTTGSKDHFITWCEVQGNRCLFIVHVPELRRFEEDAKATLADGAWLAAQVSSKKLDLPADAELAVAIRGDVLYDRLISGRLLVGVDSDAPDFEERMKSSIKRTKKGGALSDELIQYFAVSTK